MNSIVLFKNNLRINDNPALYYANKYSDQILPVYIYDDVNIKKSLGSASKYWLYNALNSLKKSLDENLCLYNGDSSKILKKIVKKYSISSIFCESPFLKDDIALLEKLKVELSNYGVQINVFNCTLLWDPKLVLKKDNTPYKVFTPFYRKGCLEKILPELPVGKPDKLNFLKINNDTDIKNLNLISTFNWYGKMNNLWEISEDAAIYMFNSFLEKSIYQYKKGRDFPASNYTSKLSAYIRFGMISVNRIWYNLNELDLDRNIAHYKSEIGWREFSYYLLYHFSYMETDNLQTKFDDFDWENSSEKFNAWKKGETGYPIVDAAMRELWETGYMHNRMRMVTASFLVKNLLIDWRLGESWFWDCLLDADYASNIAGWQWTAGTGADAAPYFRIFNPILQGEKFDNKGEYTLKYVPELKNIPLKYLQRPWEYSKNLDYVSRIINLKDSRDNALYQYSLIK
ncbi:deoxyribodipyrimidine photo-lyase [Candidatus Marinimicrobia bacterium]|nr:deoxyribodipyrimidine photo-lyase [Candidatus Neomarinimicrobiota bacterium]